MMSTPFPDKACNAVEKWAAQYFSNVPSIELLGKGKLKTVDKFIVDTQNPWASGQAPLIYQHRDEIEAFIEVLVGRGLQGTALEIGLEYGGLHVLLREVFEKVISVEMDLYKILNFLNSTTVDDRSVLVHGNSAHRETVKLCKTYSGGKLDFLFIDGDHSYNGIHSDYMLYRDLVRKGGIIAFHDTAGRDSTHNDVLVFLTRLRNGEIDGVRHNFVDIIMSGTGISYEVQGKAKARWATRLFKRRPGIGLNALQSKNDGNKEEIDGRLNGIGEMIDVLRRDGKELNAKVWSELARKLSRQLDDDCKKIDTLKNELEEQRNEAHVLIGELFERDKEIESLRGEVGKRDHGIESLRNEVERLSKKLTDRDREIKSLRSTVEERDSKIETLGGKLNVSREEAGRLSEELSGRDRKIDYLEEENRRLNGELLNIKSTRLFRLGTWFGASNSVKENESLIFDSVNRREGMPDKFLLRHFFGPRQQNDSNDTHTQQ